MPLIVITAGILQDRWLKTVPLLEARAQTRLASLSTDSIHVLTAGAIQPADPDRPVQAQIASQLADPASPVAKAIDASANVIIAAINNVLHYQISG